MLGEQRMNRWTRKIALILSMALLSSNGYGNEFCANVVQAMRFSQALKDSGQDPVDFYNKMKPLLVLEYRVKEELWFFRESVKIIATSSD